MGWVSCVRTAALVGAGVLSGALLVSFRPLRVHPKEAAAVAAPAPSAPTADLERRLARLESATSNRVGVTQPATPPHVLASQPEAAAANPDKVPSPAEVDQKLVAELNERLDEHQREAVDTVWAPEAEGKMLAALSDMAPQLHATDVSVDCKTTTCVASLQWPDYGAALRAGQQLAVSKPGVLCGKWIEFPPPDDPSQPYRGSVIYDCVPDRAQ